MTVSSQNTVLSRRLQVILSGLAAQEEERFVPPKRPVIRPKLYALARRRGEGRMHRREACLSLFTTSY